MSIFDTCTDSCGWVFAFVAAVSYGSYGVPIKHTKHIDVNPLIFQSYKTLVMFATCFGVKMLGEDIAFTKWGLLSGFMWIVGGVGGIYGIRMAGLAIAVGTWASIMVMINFFFGIIIFEEPVADIWGTLCSFLLLIVGLIGMSHYSSPQKNTPELEQEVVLLSDDLDEVIMDDSNAQEPNYQSLEPIAQDDVGMNERSDEYVVLFGGLLSMTKRHFGIIGAAMNGFMTGGSLIPLHYAGMEGFGGAKYFPSFGVGAMIANTLLWTLYYIILVALDIMHGNPISESFGKMPKWHFRALWLPGLLAGLMLALAMFSTIIAITYLGQGVGNSVVQSKILVSGLWGIFWYKEVVGADTVAKWFGSAALCMLAIIWLSLERLEAKNGHN